MGFDPATHARRNVAERCVDRLKQWRSRAPRYDTWAFNYRAAVLVAALMLWLTP